MMLGFLKWSVVLSVILLTLVSLTSGVSKVVLAAETSPKADIILPDSPIYFLQQAKEWFQYSFSFSTEQKIKTHLEIANNRVKEAALLTASGKYDLALKSLQSYNQVIERTVAITRDLVAGGGGSAVSAEVSTNLNSQHNQIMKISQNPAIKASSQVVDTSLFVGTWSSNEIAKASRDVSPSANAAAQTPAPDSTHPASTPSAQPTVSSSGNAVKAPLPLSQALVQSDSVALVSETIPDGTAIKANVKFTKTWVLKNSGPVTWHGYKIKFVKGTNLAATAEIAFADSEIISPGVTKTVNLDLVAPGTPGSYYSGWQLVNAQNVAVGNVFFANIVVPQPQTQTKPAPATSKPVSQTVSKSVVSTGWIKLPILMYHYVRTVDASKDPLGFALSVTPSNFEAQMKYLVDNGFHTVTLDDLYSAVNKGTALPSQPIVLTFDDGYIDFLTAAYPVLKKYNLTAVSYVVPGFFGNPAYLTWDQVNQLKNGGMQIASHTMHHVNLATSPKSLVESELSVSKSQLEQHLGLPILHFAYPYGGYSDAVAELVSKAGYLTAATTYGGSFHNKSTLLSLRRVRISGGDSIGVFVNKIR